MSEKPVKDTQGNSLHKEKASAGGFYGQGLCKSGGITGEENLRQ